MKVQQQSWQAGEPVLDLDHLVFVDETWASTNMARRWGRAAIGQRLVDAVPYGPGKTTTLVAALRVEALTAPLVIDGVVSGDLFVAYVAQIWVPSLRRGDVVVMDNLSSPKRSEVRRLIEAAGCRLE